MKATSIPLIVKSEVFPIGTDNKDKDESLDNDGNDMENEATILPVMVSAEVTVTNEIVQNKQPTIQQIDHDSKYHELEEQIAILKKEIEQKEKKLADMVIFQNNVGVEIEELTANLFTEAYRMVDKAKQETAIALDQCKKLQKEIDVSRHDENKKSFKNVSLHTKGSHSLNQSQESINKEVQNTEIKSLFSVFKKNFRRKSPVPVSTTSGCSANNQTIFVDPYLYHAFHSWMKLRKFDENHPLYKNVKELDMLPSLKFPVLEMSDEIFEILMSDDIELDKLEQSYRSSIDLFANNKIINANSIRPRCALMPDVQGVDYRLKLPKPIITGHHTPALCNSLTSVDDSSAPQTPAITSMNTTVMLISSLARHRIHSVRELDKFFKRTCMIGAEGTKPTQFIPEYKQLITKRRALYLARLGFASFQSENDNNKLNETRF